MTYNSSVQTQSGVESILSNTFMKGSVTVSAERIDDSIKAKMDGTNIMIAPGTKNSEVAAAIGMNSFKVKDANGKAVSKDANAGTGYVFVNTAYASDVEYPMYVYGDVNGDGEVKASDYMKIKNYIMGTTTLSNAQKMVADVNGDGEVKASDYMKIKNYIMGTAKITLSTTTTAKTTMKYSEIIMKAAQESGISPYSIAIKIIQEVGNNGSGSVSGTYPGYEGYYNFFNWGATDGNNAVAKGLEYAKGKGWNNQYTAIVEGAKQMADSYTSVGQNTAYFYKFDVINDASTGLYWHQYMTNVQDPSSQANNLYNTYTKNNILNASLNFVIPVYNNMPADKCGIPTTVTSLGNNAYSVTADVLRVRDGKGTNYTILERITQYSIVTLIEGNPATDSWVKIKTASNTEGYVSSEFIQKCN